MDELLHDLGEFGWYQKQLLWFICLPACLPCGFCAFNQIFMASSPDHWCRVPELLNLNASLRKSMAIPIKDYNESYSQCTRYDINWTMYLSSESSDIAYSKKTIFAEIPCDKGWEYNLSEVSSSIVIEFNLVCEYKIYPTLGLVALNAGGPIGVYMFGNLNDRFGRRLSFFACLAILIIGAVLTAVAIDFWSWAATRAVVGLTIPAVYQIPFIISLELVGPNYRSLVTVLTCMFYTIGLCMLAGVTYFIQEWRILSLVTSLPFTIYFFYWWFLPESPRWLIAKGRLNEANDVLMNLARINGTQLPQNFLTRMHSKISQNKHTDIYHSQKEPNITSLFKTPNMRLKTFLITLNWFANNMVYVGLSYYGPALGSEEHLSFLYSSLAEIPSYLLCWVIMDRWGRRWPLCFCMVIAGVSCIATVLLPEDAIISTLILFLLSKSAISASFLIIYPFAGELYPTQLRGVAIGFSAYISGLGLIIIPFITYLGNENLVLPLVVMGIISVIGGISALRLPETLHQRLPETIEEGEIFGSNWTWKNCFHIKTDNY
ncbi:carcinine transporter isoform X2 [Phymastichus coffea]|uniref:carcinine transporter isoform X2 n=1 Tax=Phymastichus coffea TaxID=108790 RepID=UPI00273BA468|nr:carcinine transporter isoform X2 [Phymastichus coffea]